jgi:hypothetical protein
LCQGAEREREDGGCKSDEQDIMMMMTLALAALTPFPSLAFLLFLHIIMAINQTAPHF